MILQFDRRDLSVCICGLDLRGIDSDANPTQRRTYGDLFGAEVNGQAEQGDDQTTWATALHGCNVLSYRVRASGVSLRFRSTRHLGDPNSTVRGRHKEHVRMQLITKSRVSRSTTRRQSMY